MNSTLIQSENLYFPDRNRQSLLSRLSNDILVMCKENNIHFTKGIEVQSKISKGQLYTLGELTNMIIIMSGASNKKSLNNILQCKHFYKQHLRLIFQYITGLDHYLPFAQIQAIEDPKLWQIIKDENVLTCAIGLKALAYVGRTLIFTALTEKKDKLDLKPLTMLNQLPLTKRDHELWISKNIYQLVGKKVKIVKSSQKALASIFCHKMGVVLEIIGLPTP